MTCPKCGEEIPDGSKFCPICGNQINTVQNNNQNGNAYGNQYANKYNNPQSFKVPQRPKKKSPLKIVLICVLVFLLLISVSVLANVGKSSKNKISANTTTASSAVTVSAPEQTSIDTSATQTSIQDSTQTSEQSSQQGSSDGYEIAYQNIKVENDTLGNTYAYTIVQVNNTGSDNLYLNAKSFDIEGADGSIVASESFISTVPDIIAPGETGYIYNSAPIELPKGSDPNAGYTLVPNLAIKKAQNSIVRYDISETSITQDSIGFVKIVGRVTNNTSEDESLTYVQAVLYNADGVPIGIAGTNITDLTAGSTQGFEITCMAMSSDITVDNIKNYTIYACKQQYQFG